MHFVYYSVQLAIIVHPTWSRSPLLRLTLYGPGSHRPRPRVSEIAHYYVSYMIYSVCLYVAYECGSVTYFCPAGSSYPIKVAGGYYSVGGGNSKGNLTRTAQTSAIADSCELFCALFYFSSKFSPYHFSSRPSSPFLQLNIMVFVIILVCPAGSFCSNAIPYLCPAGTYGATAGSSVSKCTGTAFKDWFWVRIVIDASL